jgi:hypothetical protein
MSALNARNASISAEDRARAICLDDEARRVHAVAGYSRGEAAARAAIDRGMLDELVTGARRRGR